MVTHIGAADQDLLVHWIRLTNRRRCSTRVGRSRLEDSPIDVLFGCLNGAISRTLNTFKMNQPNQAHALLLGVSGPIFALIGLWPVDLITTGPVFETVLDDAKIGSVSGGGRYDGLIGCSWTRHPSGWCVIGT